MEPSSSCGKEERLGTRLRWPLLVLAAFAGCGSPRVDPDGGTDGGDLEAGPPDAPGDAGPCGVVPDFLGSGPEPWPCYESPWCAWTSDLVPYTDVYGAIGDTLIPLGATPSGPDAITLTALTRFVAQPSGSAPIERAAETTYRIRLVGGRPIATIETVHAVPLAELEDAWAAELARVSATHDPVRPRPVPPTLCASLGPVDLWLAPQNDELTGVPSTTLAGAAFDRSTAESWTVELPMVPWACRGEPFVDCAFGFLAPLGAGIAYGRPLASYVLRPTDFCALDEAVCTEASRDPDPCLDAPATLSCAQTAWIRSVCATATFDDVPPADAPVCWEWMR